MPKLAGDIAREAESAADESGPEPIDDGLYTGKLIDVKVSDNAGASGHHYWTWEFELQDDDPSIQGRKMRFITSLSPKARFSVGGAFKAFGVPADTHTDELIGKLALLQVVKEPIAKGARKGQLTNNVPYISAFEGAQPTTRGYNDSHDSDF